MAEIHFIPPSKERHETSLQLQALIRAVADGTALGPRGPHIRALGVSLEVLLANLREKQAALLALPEAETPAAQSILRIIPELIEKLERVIPFSRNLPP